MDLNKSIVCVGSEYTGDQRVSDGNQTKPWFLTTVYQEFHVPSSEFIDQLINQLAIDHMGSNNYEVNQQLKLSSSPPLPSPLSNAGQWEQPSRGEGRIWTRVNFSILHLTVSDGCSRAIMGGGGRRGISPLGLIMGALHLVRYLCN